MKYYLHSISNMYNNAKKDSKECVPAGSNRVVVSWETVYVIQVCLPVLDKSFVVRGNHPYTIVTPLHATGRIVMCLEQQ